MPDIVQLGYNVESSAVDVADRKLNKLTGTTQKTQRAATRMGGATAKAGRGLNQVSKEASRAGRAGNVGAGGIRNLGLQLNQIAQQGSVTGNYLGAITTQLPDILLGFGTLGIFAGVAAGALAPLIANLASGANKADQFEDQLTEVNDSLESYRSLVELARSPTSDLEERFKGSADAARQLFNQLAEFERLEILNSSGSLLDASVLDYYEARDLFELKSASSKERRFAAGQAELAQQAQAATNIGEQVQLTERLLENSILLADRRNGRSDAENQYIQQLTESLLKLREIEAATTEVKSSTEFAAAAMDAQFQAAQRLAGTRAADTKEAQKLLATLQQQGLMQALITRYGADSAQVSRARALAERDAFEEMLRSQNISAELKRELISAWDAAKGLAATNIAGGIDTATASAQQLADTLGIAYATAVAIKNVGGGGASGPDDAIGQLQNEGRIGGVLSGVVSRVSVGPTGARSARGGGSGGGGSGASDGYQDDLDALVESLRTEQEQLEVWYAESELLLNDHRARKLLGEEEHKDQMLRLEQEYQDRLAEIQGGSQQQQLSEAAGLFGALANIAQAGGKRLAKAAATFQAVEGTINAYGAAIKALNTPGIGLAGRFAAYASVLAAGLKGVAAIRSAGGVGGGSGGSAISAAPSVEEQQAPQRIILQGLDPNALFTGEMISNLFDGIFDENNKRGGVIVVNT